MVGEEVRLHLPSYIPSKLASPELISWEVNRVITYFGPTWPIKHGSALSICLHGRT